ncbi:MAG: SIR2 family protein [Bacteroidetes bacterium]|nr:SIR2 family protein [Bacteroidota bacterium]
MATNSLVREIRELKTQLSYSKNIGFFFGAGSSCALGIPNIVQLTKDIKPLLGKDELETFNKIFTELKTTIKDREVNIEDILNHLRRIRELTNEQKTKEYIGINGESAKKADIQICKKIYKVILEKENIANLDSTKKFFAWLSLLNREYSKEIFTTNYDLIIEKSLEANQIPYFDGFVGSFEPFFLQSSIDHEVHNKDLTKNWIRLWKIHGSLSWFWKKDTKLNAQKIIRIGKIADISKYENELVIYPSKDKYDSSRKQPFIAYFDRLKNYLSNGELLFIFVGYSFSDQHINDIIFNCLRENNRLFAIVFFYKDDEVERLHKLTSSYLNLNVYGPTKAIINGELVEWNFDKNELKPSEEFQHYWDESNNKMLIGDFNKLVDFLLINSGKKEIIEKTL